MAVRAGVTRNEEIGQGNGLSGSLNLAVRTRGIFGITSGQSSVIWHENKIEKYDYESNESFFGTIVDMQIPYDQEFDVAEILNESTSTPNYSKTKYSPADFLDERYTTEDGKCLIVKVHSETVGFGTRHGGAQIRNKCINLMEAEPNLPLLIDWNGIQVISSSFADEFLGKLFVSMGPLNFSARIANRNMVSVVQALVDRAILQRTKQVLLGSHDIDEFND